MRVLFKKCCNLAAESNCVTVRWGGEQLEADI
ncbi:MAG: hypothetical protein ACI8RA_002971, partial [Chlamydiales bacterium]